MAPMNISHSLVCHLLRYILNGSLPKLYQMTLPFIQDGQREKWKSWTIFFTTNGYNENLNKKILEWSLPKWCLLTLSTFQHGCYIVKVFQIPDTNIFNMLVEKGRWHMEDSHLKLFCIKNSLLSFKFHYELCSTLLLIKITRSDIFVSPKMDITFLIKFFVQG